MSRYDSPGLEPGSWGEFYSALEHMTTRMQSSKFNAYELAQSLLLPLQINVVDKYNAAMTKLSTHTVDYSDPHLVTRDTLGLGLVDNRDTATITQITTGGFDDLFISADGFSALAAKVFGDFADRLHHQGINPISVYGDVSWLPPDVSGSFEGSGMASGNAGGASLIEDDGTWIGLRFGTNGTSQGLYYFYMSNAEDRIDNVGPVRMNLRYEPSNRPPGFTCTDTLSSDATCILGIGVGHATYNAFLSLTNGTMDVSKHYVGYFDYRTLGINEYSQFCTACVAGNYVYMFAPQTSGSWQGFENSAPYEVKVFRVPVATIVTGGAFTWEAVTAWNSTGLWGNTGVAPNVVVAPTMVSANPANKPFVLHENRVWMTTISAPHSGKRSYCTVNPTNPNQIRLVMYHTVWTSLANGTNIMPNFGWSLLINVSGKTAAVEDGASYIRHVSPNGDSVSLQSTCYMEPNQITGYPWGGNYWPNTLITERGYMLSRGTGNQPDENNMFFRAQISNFVNEYDALRIRNRVVRPISSAADTIRVGSAFTNGCMNPRLLPGPYLMYNGTAISGSNQFSYGRAKRLQFVGNPTFDYGTINSGTLKGWAPNSTRTEFTENITFNQAIFISRTASDGSIACDASVLSNGTTLKSSGTSINKDLVMSGAFTWSTTEGDNLAITIARQLFARTNIYRAAWTIYMSQDTNIPVLMVMAASTPRDDANGFRALTALCELNYAGARSGNVTGYSLNRVLNSVIYDQQPGDAYCQYETMSGLQSYKCADGTYLLSIGSPPVFRVYGGQYGCTYYGVVRAGAKTIEDSTVKRFDHGYFPMSDNPSGFVHPSYGLCVMDYKTNQANYNAVMVVNVIGNTYADYVAWAAKQKLVIGAQEVEQGWIVYFTADAPVFLAGREWTLPATSIDLRTVNASPGNKTFYAYVRLTGAGVGYFITTDPLAPTMTMMYIGKIVTIATQISTMEINKKVRVDTFELSPTHIGSGIPTGVGVPSQTGDFTGWLIPYLRANRKILKFGAVLDYEGRFSVNLRTGMISVGIMENGVSSSSTPVTYYETGEVWNPGIVTGTTGDGTTLTSKTKVFAGLAVPSIAAASSWQVSIGNYVGRDQPFSIIQPSPANDFAATIVIRDNPATPLSYDTYSFDLYVTIK